MTPWIAPRIDSLTQSSAAAGSKTFVGLREGRYINITDDGTIIGVAGPS